METVVALTQRCGDGLENGGTVVIFQSKVVYVAICLVVALSCKSYPGACSFCGCFDAY